jgi:flagellar hook assembly protein FlgD
VCSSDLLSQIAPSAAIIGSSPAISALNPFVFRYTLGREGVTGMKILDNTGMRVVRTLLDNTVRPGLFSGQERWEEAVDDTGRWVTSGTYIAQLTAADPLCPMKVSTVSVSFAVDLFRITDVMTTPLLTGASDTVTLSYQLSQSMNVGWNIYPPGTTIKNSTGTWPLCNSINPGSCWQAVNAQDNPVAPLITIRGMRPGRMRITESWDGRDVNGVFVPDGNYVFTLAAESTTTPRYFASDRVFGSVTVSRGSILFSSFRVDPDVPVLYNSSATITLHPYTISYALNRQSSVTVQILNSAASPQVVRTLFSGSVRNGGMLLEEVWDGRDDRGNFLPSGFYLVRAVAEDVASQLSSGNTAQLTIAYDPLRIFDVAVAPLRNDSGAQILYQVSETMKVAVKIFRPGTVFDMNGNPSPPESVSLVKRIIGVRPARTQIIESWDGLDLRSGITTDGNYKFKIVGSTDINAIDNITGNVISPTALSLDRPIDDIPVVRNESLDPKQDFENNTYVYPNPISGETAHFVIFSPFQARVSLRIFTINGEEVLRKDFAETAANSYVLNDPINGFTWDRKNHAGRRLARGMYYALVRLEETLGGKNVLQTVKRFLIK